MDTGLKKLSCDECTATEFLIQVQTMLKGFQQEIDETLEHFRTQRESRRLKELRDTFMEVKSDS
jgi:predicted glycosyltransferase